MSVRTGLFLSVTAAVFLTASCVSEPAVLFIEVNTEIPDSTTDHRFSVAGTVIRSPVQADLRFTVTVEGETETLEVLASSVGIFTAEIALVEGDNLITLVASDETEALGQPTSFVIKRTLPVIIPLRADQGSKE